MESKHRHSVDKTICTCLMTFSLLLTAQKNKSDIQYVSNIRDFEVHTLNHIQNVYRLGMHFYYTHKDTHFKDVPEHLIREKLLLHDYEKLADIKTLKSFGYNHDKTFITRLFENYGQRKNEELVIELNIFATLLEQNYFKKFKLTDKNGKLSPIAEKIVLIEQIADKVEREKNPVSPEEFGVIKMKSAADYLETDFEKESARSLAAIYDQIVNPNPLLYVVKTNDTKSCSALFHAL